MSYEIESSTDTELIKTKREPLWIPLTDETGCWNDEAMKWFNSPKLQENRMDEV